MTRPKINHHKNSGCFSNFLQKIVCAGDLPTHPCPPDEFVQKIGKSNSVCDPKKHIVANQNGSDIADRSRVQIQVRDQVSPGIVAKLMGLDSMPRYESATKSSSTYESLFRSKSLNSLHFRPDFDPIRAAFHRRGRTSSSASFHDQGRMILVTIDENLESNGVKLKEDCKVGREELKQKREKVLKIKGNDDSNECRKVRKNNVRDKKRYQERYYKGDSVNKGKSRSKKGNVGAIGGLGGNNSREKSKSMIQSSRLVKTKTVSHQTCSSRIYEERKDKVSSPVLSKKVERKRDLYGDQSSSDVSLRSPISVLDHQDEVDSPYRDATQITSNLRRKSSPRSKLFSDMPKEDVHVHMNSNKNDDESNKSSSKHQLMEVDTQVTEYFVDLLSKACIMGEEQICEDLKRVTGKYELFKQHYVENLCQVLGQEMLEALLRELVYELS